MCDGSSNSTSTSQAANTTNVSVASNTTIDTTDLASAIEALAAANEQDAEAGAAVSVYNANVAAKGQVASAEIAASAGPDWSTVFFIVTGGIGLAMTMGWVKFPKMIRV